jgi:DNA mismatch endonuclease (patch repair protein)
MSRIRSTNTQPELAMRQILLDAGIKYRLHDSKLPGRPDLVIRARKALIFVDGCFWHGCPQHYTRPRTRRAYWDKKLQTNRDQRAHVLSALAANGWTAFQIWECEVESRGEKVAATLLQLPRVM